MLLVFICNIGSKHFSVIFRIFLAGVKKDLKKTQALNSKKSLLRTEIMVDFCAVSVSWSTYSKFNWQEK